METVREVSTVLTFSDLFNRRFNGISTRKTESFLDKPLKLSELKHQVAGRPSRTIIMQSTIILQCLTVFESLKISNKNTQVIKFLFSYTHAYITEDTSDKAFMLINMHIHHLTLTHTPPNTHPYTTEHSRIHHRTPTHIPPNTQAIEPLCSYQTRQEMIAKRTRRLFRQALLTLSVNVNVFLIV